MASGLLPGFLASNGHLGGEGGRLAAQALSADGGSGAGASNAALIVVHGLLMVTSWVVLAPLGFMMARYERARPPTGWWFKWHRALMLAAVSCTLVGFVFALILVNGVHFNSTHAQCGLLLLFMLLQLLNGLLRPKHEAKWRRPGALPQVARLLLLFAMLTAILGSLESGGGAAVVAPLIIVIVLVVGVLAFREFRACKGKSGPYGAGGGGGGGPALQKGGGGGLPPGWSSAIDPNSGRTYYVNWARGQPPGAARRAAAAAKPAAAAGAAAVWREVERGEGPEHRAGVLPQPADGGDELDEAVTTARAEVRRERGLHSERVVASRVTRLDYHVKSIEIVSIHFIRQSYQPLRAAATHESQTTLREYLRPAEHAQRAHGLNPPLVPRLRRG